MASVELRPGDTLTIVWTTVQDTPLGAREIEAAFDYSYNELLDKLKSQQNTTPKQRKPGSAGVRFSRLISLAANAIHKGKWCTGADIDRSEVFGRLVQQFAELPESEYANITVNARQTLHRLVVDGAYLTTSQRKKLKKIEDCILAVN